MSDRAENSKAEIRNPDIPVDEFMKIISGEGLIFEEFCELAKYPFYLT